ncbi:hypothetical protein O181_058036 [Austropuccinia psidii MF-1]|uniref:Glutamine amidotransferase type-2 domain-containing protein n=1 Tax=Austropuccinia psidii MF-1 TaxID=1389203 RepID=A0A9Q3HUH6_9BASI|nr:hypothetical protein [Austropuccinia psidii MF-1]
MCGIGLALQKIPKSNCSPPASQDVDGVLRSIKLAISSRGPDLQTQTTRIVQGMSSEFDLKLWLLGSVLHLRGNSLTAQPITSLSSGSLLLWNGEVFNGLALPQNDNDGQVVFAQLECRASRSVPQVLVDIEGPYAFIYYDAVRQEIWFGRDPLGRRSLMILHQESPHENPIFSLASHFDGQAAIRSTELTTQSLFCIQCSDVKDPFEVREVQRGPLGIFLNRRLPLESDRISLCHLNNKLPPDLTAALSRFRGVLTTSVRRRLDTISNLYRNDEDESSTAILFSGGLDCTTIALIAHSYLPMNESIDLINVAFENPRSLSKFTTETSLTEEHIFSVPDRRTGFSSWRELCDLVPQRTWRFVMVDVWMADYLKYKDQIIQLMRPNFTVMDLSIAAALFFAARGIGKCLVASCPNEQSLAHAYCSPARVYLSGLGADELLAGYSRHRSAFFSPTSWISLIDELQLDIDRIPTRNLGRDDRIISFFGREVRYPFLDKEVINVLADLPVHLKCALELGKGIGDKLLLRLLARELGLKQASKLEKRAIQFGARSAKLEGMEKGTNKLIQSIPDSSQLDFRPVALSLKSTFFTGRQRLTSPQVNLSLAKLTPTQEDRRVGLFPSTLKLSKLFFTSCPAGQTVILGYPSHISLAKTLSEKSQHTFFPAKPYYKMTSILQKGIGMLANCTIPIGTTILSERPVLIMPEQLEAPTRQELDDVHLAAFDELSFEQQLGLSALASATEDDKCQGHPLVNRIWNNEICFPLASKQSPPESPYPYSAVYLTISRFNHSCSPNARWHFDQSTFSLHLCAVRDIAEEEEITVSYIDHLCCRAERQERLYSKWAFECRCPACGLDDNVEKQKSDSRRELLGKDYAYVQDLLKTSMSSYCEDLHKAEKLIERLQSSILLVSQENLHEEYALFGRALAKVYHFIEENKLASATCAKYLAILGAVQGFGSPEWLELKSIMTTQRDNID